MILLDPDLEPHPAGRHPSPSSSLARGKAAPRSAGQTPKANALHLKIPTARTLARFLKLAQEAVRLRGQVTVLLTTDAAIRGLNRRFRGKNEATDVLSFPAADAGPVRIAGDIAISVDTARRQGAAHGHSLGVEIKVLMLHGLLHLAGYDHETDEGRMARREQALRGRLGLPLGLIERAGSRGASGELSSLPGPQMRGTRGTHKAAYSRTLLQEAQKDGAPSGLRRAKR